jgi:hypothetical protein
VSYLYARKEGVRSTHFTFIKCFATPEGKLRRLAVDERKGQLVERLVRKFIEILINKRR